MRHHIELIEVMTYRVLLEARGRVEFLHTTYGKALAAKWQAEAEPADIQAKVAAMPGDDPAAQLISYLAGYDPSANQQYTQWLVLRYLKGGLRLEDLEAAKDYLARFTEMKTARQLPKDKADINRVGSLADLAELVGQQQQAVVTGAAAEEQRMLAQAKILYDGADCRILVPLTQAAACYFGRNTEWCTAWGNHTELGLSQPGRHPTRTNRYSYYQERGPLYIIEVKPQGDNPLFAHETLFQYHAETGQFTDVNDRGLSGQSVARLLRAYPTIMRVIGEPKFAGSHLGELGLRYFSPATLATLDRTKLMRAIRDQEDFAALPEPLRHDPEFLAEFLANRIDMAERVIPREDLTGEVAAALRRITADRDRHNSGWRAFELFPMAEWSPEAVAAATEAGRLTYAQYAALPADQQSPEQLRRLIAITAAKHPDQIADYPPGLIDRLGVVEEIIRRNPSTMQYLSAADLSEQALIQLGKAGVTSQGMDALGYLPPERLTDAVVEAINHPDDSVNAPRPPLQYGAEGQQQIRVIWARHIQRAINDDDARRTERYIDVMPLRYRDDPAFFATVLADKLEQTRTGYQFKNSGLNSWLHRYFQLSQKFSWPVTTPMLAMLVSVLPAVQDRRLNSEWRPTLLRYQDLWDATVIKTALTKGLLKPDDIPDTSITPEVAARLFALDPARQELAYQADDASLIHEIDTQGYSRVRLIAHMPKDRITEPIAYAAVKRERVPDAKQVLPKTALSRRVYAAGVPYSFSLNQVPKAVRTDDAVIKQAVTRDSSQLKYVPHALDWLKAHIDPNDMPDHWRHDIEKLGLVATNSGFAAIEDLPHDALIDGYTLYRAAWRKQQRWFVRKDGKTILTMSIGASRKLSVGNTGAAKDLTPVLLDLARRFLTGVDITVLNRVGIYRSRGGSVQDRSERYGETTKETIAGLDWAATPHLRGKLYTAWLDKRPIMTVYKADAEGWGRYHTIIRDITVVDHKACFAHAAAIIEGLKNISRHAPDYGRHTLMQIGIQWSKAAGYWIATARRVGKLGKFTVYYNSGQRFISIYDTKGLAASAYVLKKGGLATNNVAYRISETDQPAAELLNRALATLAERVTKGELRT